MTGSLVVFEGLDQSGKQTQAETLTDHLTSQGRTCALLSFPDYSTSIGQEIAAALNGSRDYPADVLQLLYVANRGEKRAFIEDAIAKGIVVVCDRYMASSIAYGEAHGVDPQWLTDIQRFLPVPDLTVLLDIAPETAAGRKAAGRDRFERDMALLSRVRASYRRQAAAPGWIRLDGEREKSAVAADVIRAVATRLALPSVR
ncbi:MAG TPA: dTMP kinase [Vicinamibacterales bacterium]|jgi:dTMP kinase